MDDSNLIKNQIEMNKLEIPCDRSDIVFRILKPDIQNIIKNNDLIIFYGLYGWAWAGKSGFGTACSIGMHHICKEAYEKWVETKNDTSH